MPSDDKLVILCNSRLLGDGTILYFGSNGFTNRTLSRSFEQLRTGRPKKLLGWRTVETARRKMDMILKQYPKARIVDLRYAKNYPDPYSCWLVKLQSGDAVRVSNAEQDNVERITFRFVILNGGRRFSRRDGWPTNATKSTSQMRRLLPNGSGPSPAAAQKKPIHRLDGEKRCYRCGAIDECSDKKGYCRECDRSYALAYREARRAKGVCYTCGKRKPVMQDKQCRQCIARQKEITTADIKKHIALGVLYDCNHCGEEKAVTRPGQWCSPCARRYSPEWRASRVRRGKCAQCGKPNSRRNRITCLACAIKKKVRT